MLDQAEVQFSPSLVFCLWLVYLLTSTVRLQRSIVSESEAAILFICLGQPYCLYAWGSRIVYIGQLRSDDKVNHQNISV